MVSCCVSLGFVFGAVAASKATDCQRSPWVIGHPEFMGVGKGEAVLLQRSVTLDVFGEGGWILHRRVLSEQCQPEDGESRMVVVQLANKELACCSGTTLEGDSVENCGVVNDDAWYIIRDGIVFCGATPASLGSAQLSFAAGILCHDVRLLVNRRLCWVSIEVCGLCCQ